MDAAARTEKVSQFVTAWREYKTILEGVKDSDFKFGVVVSRDGSRLNELALRFAAAEILQEQQD
jgi:hypothetical protein